MNFEKIKEHEDIQKELKRLGEGYNNILIKKKEQYILNFYEGFKDFFYEQNFSIREDNQYIEAYYGNANMKLKKVNVHDSYISAYSVWEIENSTNKSKYKIILNELNRYPTIKTTFSSGKKLTEEEQLDKDIEESKKRLEDLKENIKKFDSTQWAYGVVNDNDNISVTKYPQFEHVRDALREIYR